MYLLSGAEIWCPLSVSRPIYKVQLLLTIVACDFRARAACVMEKSYTISMISNCLWLRLS